MFSRNWGFALFGVVMGISAGISPAYAWYGPFCYSSKARQVSLTIPTITGEAPGDVKVSFDDNDDKVRLVSVRPSTKVKNAHEVILARDEDSRTGVFAVIVTSPRSSYSYKYELEFRSDPAECVGAIIKVSDKFSGDIGGDSPVSPSAPAVSSPASSTSASTRKAAKKTVARKRVDDRVAGKTAQSREAAEDADTRAKAEAAAARESVPSAAGDEDSVTSSTAAPVSPLEEEAAAHISAAAMEKPVAGSASEVPVLVGPMRPEPIPVDPALNEDGSAKAPAEDSPPKSETSEPASDGE